MSAGAQASSAVVADSSTERPYISMKPTRGLPRRLTLSLEKDGFVLAAVKAARGTTMASARAEPADCRMDAHAHFPSLWVGRANFEIDRTHVDRVHSFLVQAGGRLP